MRFLIKGENKMELKNVLNLWKKEKIIYVKKSTFVAYNLLIEKHILPYFGNNKKITEQEVQEFVFNKINHGLSQSTIKTIIMVLKMVIKFGVRKKIFDGDEIIRIKFPTKLDRPDLQILAKYDHQKIISYVKDNFSFKNLGIYICLLTGVRIGEVCGLRWSDFDTVSGVIKIRRTVQRIYIIDETNKHTELLVDEPKTKNSIRDIPMSRELAKAIKSLKKTINEKDYILTNSNRPTEPRVYRAYYSNLLKKLNIPKLKFHGLRHSFATRCIESKCDYKTVSVLLGHSSISTTLNLYVHPNLEQKKKCINQMCKFLNRL